MHRINLRPVLVITIVSLMITACGQRVPIETELTTTRAPVVMIPAIAVTVSNTPTQERSATPLPTATEVPTTHIASPSLTGNPLEELRDDIPSCSNNGRAVDADLVEGFHVDGTILYHRNDPLGLYAISGDTNNLAKIELPGPRSYEYFGVSPNGKWLAVTPFEPDENLNKDQENWPILLISNTGQMKETSVNLANFTAFAQSFHDELRFIYLTGSWLNNDTLALNVAYSSYPGQVRPVSIRAYINPFTGKLQEKPQVPKLGSYQRMDDNYVSISPDLSRGFFLTDYAVTVWDFQKQQVLKIWKNLGVSGGMNYFWSPNSQWALFSSDDLRLLLIDRSGENIIDLDKEYLGNSDVTLAAYEGSWSPDGHYLGVNLLITEESTYSQQNFLLVFDLEEKQYVFQCELYDNEDYPLIQWSPDSAYVIPLFPRSVDSPIKIIDINRRVVYQLPQEGNVVGWAQHFIVADSK